jgi:hypothetical protein
LGLLGATQFGYQLVARTVMGGIAGGVVSEIYGGNFWEGFARAASNAAASFLFNEMIGHIAEKGGIGDVRRYSERSNVTWSVDIWCFRLYFTPIFMCFDMDALATLGLYQIEDAPCIFNCFFSKKEWELINRAWKSEL